MSNNHTFQSCAMPRWALAQVSSALRVGEALAASAWARFTGKAQPGQAPILNLTGAQWCAINMTVLIGAVAANAAILNLLPRAGGWAVPALIAVGYLMIITTGALRNFQVTYAHHAVHGTLFRSARLNRLAACLATVIPFAQNETDYRADHVGRHHRRTYFTTALDPDAAFLLSLGFRPGMSKAQAWRRFLFSLVSPKFHWTLTWARFTSTFLKASWPHRLAAIAWAVALAQLALAMPTWIFACAVLLPLGPLYNASALTQFVTEHAWLITPEGPGRDNIAYAQRCVARFCVSRPPARNLPFGASLAAWTLWAVKLVCVHAPIRFGVLVGDLCVHSFHHTAALAGCDPEAWPNAVYERQAALDRQNPIVLAESEAWGIGEALDWVFEGLARANPNQV